MARYCFDIDGTICMTVNSDYQNSTPLHGRIAKVNTLFEAGHEIVFFTARGATSGRDWRELTENQLLGWGVKYHHLILGKPHSDYYIDDKGVKDTDFFTDG